MYSELQQYYEAFRENASHGDGRAPEDCRCRGTGWLLSEVDTFHRCRDHHTGQPHPEDCEDV